jgi:hypothetical protein
MDVLPAYAFNRTTCARGTGMHPHWQKNKLGAHPGPLMPVEAGHGKLATENG